MFAGLSGGATIASVVEDFEEQPSLLRALRESSLWSELEEAGEPVLVGAGDSYAAALCASFLAGPRAPALDPYSLSKSAGWASRRPVFIISISGQTTSNIELARALRGVAASTTAITSNPESPLAETVDRVVELPYRPPRKSPGISSFTLSLAAALRVCGFDSHVDFTDALHWGIKLSRRVKIARGSGVTHFAGNNEAYAASIYGTAKIYELVGRRAQASLLEEFSHMPLFSLSARDSINVLDCPPAPNSRLLHRLLSESGYSSSLVRLGGERVERLFRLVFALQMAAIRAAKAEGLHEPYFLGAKKKLKISDRMIY